MIHNSINLFPYKATSISKSVIMNKDKNSLLIAGLAGAALGYFIGKNYSADATERLKLLAGDAEKIKKEVSNVADGSTEVVEDLREKAIRLIEELESKLSVVNDVLQKDGK